MQRVFNLGLGFVVFCRERAAAAVLAGTAAAGGRRVGRVEARPAGAARVVVEGLA
jgi:phosphoribosylaminoimidazole (AIR) synthetase